MFCVNAHPRRSMREKWEEKWTWLGLNQQLWCWYPNAQVLECTLWINDRETQTFPCDWGWYGRLLIIFTLSDFATVFTAPLNSDPWSVWMFRRGPTTLYNFYSSSATQWACLEGSGDRKTYRLNISITESTKLYTVRSCFTGIPRKSTRSTWFLSITSNACNIINAWEHVEGSYPQHDPVIINGNMLRV